MLFQPDNHHREDDRRRMDELTTKIYVFWAALEASPYAPVMAMVIGKLLEENPWDFGGFPIFRHVMMTWWVVKVRLDD